MKREAINISLQSLAVGPGTDYWLNMEQVQELTDAITFEQAAEFIDALYDIDPCVPIEDEAGGEEAEQDNEGNPVAPVEEEEFVSLAQQMLERAALCGTLDGSYECTIRVARSHQGEPYKLVIDAGEELQRVTEQGRASQTLIVEGEASASLELPVLGNLTTEWQGPVYDLSGVCPGPAIELLGSTLNFGKRITGTVTAHFDTQYDLVTLKIDGNEEGEPQPARVLAFYAGLVAEHDVEPPEVSEEDEETRRKLCDEAGADLNPTPDSVTCYEIVESVVRCRCSGKVIEEKTTTAEHSVTCPDGITCPGGESECRHFMGSRQITRSYTACRDEEDQENDVGDPEFYLETCCEPVPDWYGWLPPCRVVTKGFPGGHGVSEEDMAAYPGAVFIPVGPADGQCGEIVTTWQVAARNCCDGAEPLAWDSASSISTIGKSSMGAVHVTGGANNADREWEVHGQGIFTDLQHTRKRATTSGNWLRVYTDDTACGTFTVEVTDGCSSAYGYIMCTDGQWVLVAVSEGNQNTISCEVTGDGVSIGGGGFEQVQDGLMLREWVECRSGVDGAVTCSDQDGCCGWYAANKDDFEWPPCLAAAEDYIINGYSICSPAVCTSYGDRCYNCDEDGGMFQIRPTITLKYKYYRRVWRRELYEWVC